MKKTIYRIMGIIVTFALALGGYTKAQARPMLAVTGKPVYAYYYLWWSTQHWKDKLGSNYPYSASPLPLPATADADGCNAVSKYSGNHLIDVPAALFSQDEAGVIEGDTGGLLERLDFVRLELGRVCCRGARFAGRETEPGHHPCQAGRNHEDSMGATHAGECSCPGGVCPRTS